MLNEMSSVILTKLNLRGFKFYFVDGILNAQFQAEDIASDCFHPSIQGHKKIANELSDEVSSIFRHIKPN